tara:strand:+ start:718 stop:1344 length:627 start_codon:yes stop_codon:yes gene_type:complete
MEDLSVTTLIKIFKHSVLFGLLVFSTSCDYLKKSFGVSKNVIDDSQPFESPDLVLPPDFDVSPKNENVNSYSDSNQIKESLENNEIKKRRFDIPVTKNFIAPRVTKPLANSPSDSIRKFSNNRNFTLGEWVYKQSIDDFRSNNFYYVPRYEKGYNFSRKYVPRDYNYQETINQTIQSKNLIQDRSLETNEFDNEVPSSQSIGDLPVLD